MFGDYSKEYKADRIVDLETDAVTIKRNNGKFIELDNETSESVNVEELAKEAVKKEVNNCDDQESDGEEQDVSALDKFIEAAERS